MASPSCRCQPDPARTLAVVLSGIIGVAAGIGTLYVASVLVAWYLIVFGIIHLVHALAGPELGYWWTGLLLGVAELALGVWAIVFGVNGIFAAFTVREVGKQAKRLAD